MPSVISERHQFIDEATGELIVNGYIYIGTQNLDAKLNPITIYPDRALSGTPLANPQRTGSDGRALNKIWIPAKYSMKVEDSNNSQKLNDLDRGSDPQTGNTKLINVLGVNDLVAEASPTITTLIDNQTYIFSAPAAPTGAMTLTIDTTTIKDIKKGDGLAIEANDFAASQKIVVVYNETDDWFEVTSGVLNNTFAANVNIGEDLRFTGAAPEITTTTTNADLNVIPNGVGEFQYKGKEVNVMDLVVAGHIRAGNMQISDGSLTTDTSINVADLTATATFETFGPTGSGATNIVSDMDSIPSTATMVIFDVDVKGDPATTTTTSASFHCASGDVTTPIASDNTRVLASILYPSGTSTDGLSYRSRVIIPINSSLVFKGTWSSTGSPTDVDVILYYRGFMTD